MKSAIFILILAVLMGSCAGIPPVRPVDNVFFTIGREDKSDREFRSLGLNEITEYRCRVGVDCSTEAFPAYLNRGATYAYGGVERIIISFRLDQSYNNVILRLARGGDETTVVIVDGKQTYRVTNTMLGSGEGFRVGAYNLEISSLKKGVHTIEMSMADDGKGNNIYQWDALSLFVR